MIKASCAFVLVLAAPAVAQPPPPDADVSISAGAASALQGLWLPSGALLIAGQTLNINLSDGSSGEPISLAPSLWFGASDKLTIGITHDLGATWWTPRPVPGAGICLTGEDGGCGDSVYDNVGADVIYGFKDDIKLALAFHGGLYANGFDPLLLKLRAGLLGRVEISSTFSLVFDPALFIGLTEREGPMGQDRNKEVLDLPLWVWYAVNGELGIYGGISITGPLSDFGDRYQVPVGFGASYQASASLTLGGDFWFTDLIGSSDSDLDGRAVSLRVAFAM